MPESGSRGGTWSWGLYLVLGGVLSPKGVYLVLGVYLVPGGVLSPKGVSGPGGCLVPGGVWSLGGVCSWRVSAPGGSAQGGVVSHHALRQTPPREQNDKQV